MKKERIGKYEIGVESPHKMVGKAHVAGGEKWAIISKPFEKAPAQEIRTDNIILEEKCRQSGVFAPVGHFIQIG